MRKTMRLHRTVIHAWPEWIDVRDELPPPVTDVLTVDDKGRLRIAWYASTKNEWSGPYALPIAVTHWMPLPESPEDGR